VKGRSTFTAYELLAIVNQQPGNGHFREAMQWFEQSCRRDHKRLIIRECWNLRLAWMLWKTRLPLVTIIRLGKNFDV
jgi:hypothetical protein